MEPYEIMVFLYKLQELCCTAIVVIDRELVSIMYMCVDHQTDEYAFQIMYYESVKFITVYTPEEVLRHLNEESKDGMIHEFKIEKIIE